MSQVDWLQQPVVPGFSSGESLSDVHQVVTTEGHDIQAHISVFG